MEVDEFIKVFSDGFRKGDQSGLSFFLLFVGIACFILLFTAIFSAIQNKHWIKGRWIYFKKTWKGQAVSKDRRPRSFEVIIQMPYKGTPERTRTVNLSPNGMFVRMDPPLMVGESFRFLLNLDSQNSLSGTAEVRWSQEKATPYTPPGIGCKFYQMKDQDKALIKKFLRL